MQKDKTPRSQALPGNALPRRLWLLVPTLLLLILFAQVTPADELHTLSGKKLSGTLTEISDTSLTIYTDEGPVTTLLPQVLALDVKEIRGSAPGTKFTDVRLLDDSLLHCKEVSFKNKGVDLTLLTGTKITVPLNAIVWIIRDAHDPKITKNFEQLLASKAKRDRLVILSGGTLNPLEGTLGDADAEGKSIQFVRDGAAAIPILFERIQGLIFYRSETVTDPPMCKVIDRDGNIIGATKLELKDGDLSLVTGFGGKVTLPRDRLGRIDFNLGKLTYLSDWEPNRAVQKSGIGLALPYRKDVNLDGEPINLDHPYAKGLSLHAYTELDYNLAGNYKSFKATMGVDVRTGAQSQALVSIYCDGAKRFSEVVDTKTPRPIVLNVTDVITLRIVVSGPNILQLHDHATLADARVTQ